MIKDTFSIENKNSKVKWVIYKGIINHYIILLSLWTLILIMMVILIVEWKGKNKSANKQSFKGVLKKRCSENMPQIYRRTPMPNCDFYKIAKHLTYSIR